MGPAHQGGRHFCGLMVKEPIQEVVESDESVVIPLGA
jgi:hypothetical protein